MAAPAAVTAAATFREPTHPWSFSAARCCCLWLHSSSQDGISPPDSVSGRGSTDVGDVSWVVPTTQFFAATWVPGTPPHTWQAVAASGTTIGEKGMLVASKTLALTLVDLFSDPTHVREARAEFEEQRGSHAYSARIGDRPPPLDYRKKL